LSRYGDSLTQPSADLEVVTPSNRYYPTRLACDSDCDTGDYTICMKENSGVQIVGHCTEVVKQIPRFALSDTCQLGGRCPQQ